MIGYLSRRVRENERLVIVGSPLRTAPILPFTSALGDQ